jgi:hypothetical protein
LALGQTPENLTLTIPHKFSKRKDSVFPFGCANAAAKDRQRCSNVYEVDQWLWQFGCCKPRLGGLTVDETEMRKEEATHALRKHAAETRQRHKTAQA